MSTVLFVEFCGAVAAGTSNRIPNGQRDCRICGSFEILTSRSRLTARLALPYSLDCWSLNIQEQVATHACRFRYTSRLIITNPASFLEPRFWTTSNGRPDGSVSMATWRLSTTANYLSQDVDNSRPAFTTRPGFLLADIFMLMSLRSHTLGTRSPPITRDRTPGAIVCRGKNLLFRFAIF